MRDQLDAQIWVAHHEGFSADIDRALAAISAFEIGARVITATRLKERDVMNLKNLVYYLRAKLMRNDSGQDLLEYALLVALIALVCVGVITSTGSGVQSIFNDISNELKTANP
jgi:pilus assembly protein Flp/PilA